MSADGKQIEAASDVTCAVCGDVFAADDVRPWIAVRPSISEFIAEDVPGWHDGAYICRRDYTRYRQQHVEHLLREERGDLGPLDQQVLESIKRNELVTQKPNNASVEITSASFGERMSDHVANFGGSWTFILSFCTVLVVWMTLNVGAWLFKPFDPYPFILLNLLLSCVAAMQAPIIMMSQRRQEAKDRLHAENDYRVNLKAELEIRLLHEKLDHQMIRQWQRIAELQRIQIELIEERDR